MIIKVVQYFIKKLKKDGNYRIESSYTYKQISISIYYRLLQLIRGLKYKLFLGASSGFLFFGRRVIIEHAYMVKIGKNIILEDDVFINGLSDKGIILGDNVSIGKKSALVGTAVIAQKGEGIKLGNNVGLNSSCYIGGQGGVVIEDNVIIGPDVQIFSENHNYSQNSLICYQGVTRKEVRIKKNCWIGAGAIILSGVTINEGCVISAGSVVTKDIPKNSVAAGVPAQIIKSRII